MCIRDSPNSTSHPLPWAVLLEPARSDETLSGADPGNNTGNRPGTGAATGGTLPGCSPAYCPYKQHGSSNGAGKPGQGDRTKQAIQVSAASPGQHQRASE